MHQNLVIFDFDGTITKRDSFIELIKYYKGLPAFYFGFIILSPILILYKAKIFKNWKAKEFVFTYFFRNESYSDFKNKCGEFSRNIIPCLIKPRALEAINNHLKNGDKVIVISASFEDQLRDWCKLMNLELIGTKIMVRDNLITGKLNGKNCYGIEKVVRLNQYINISQFHEIYAYGDSKGDLEMLEIASHKFYKPF